MYETSALFTAQAYAQQNKESVSELLIEFFRYFCWSFDLRHRVVSIRQPRALSKLDKAEQNGWLQSDNLGCDHVFPFLPHFAFSGVILYCKETMFCLLIAIIFLESRTPSRRTTT